MKYMFQSPPSKRKQRENVYKHNTYTCRAAVIFQVTTPLHLIYWYYEWVHWKTFHWVKIEILFFCYSTSFDNNVLRIKKKMFLWNFNVIILPQHWRSWGKNILGCLGNLTFEILAFYCLHLKVMTLAMHHLYIF